MNPKQTDKIAEPKNTKLQKSNKRTKSLKTKDRNLAKPHTAPTADFPKSKKT